MLLVNAHNRCFHGKIRKNINALKKHLTSIKSYVLEEKFLITPLCFTFMNKYYLVFLCSSFLVNSHNYSQDKIFADSISVKLKYLVLRQLWNNCGIFLFT